MTENQAYREGEQEPDELLRVAQGLLRAQERINGLRRGNDVELFRKTLVTFVNGFLAWRQEIESAQFDVRRAEYERLQRQVVRAYRSVADLYREFLREEPNYDLRGDLFDEGGHAFPIDYPLTEYWRALTLDEAVAKWSNSDDEHFRRHFDRQRAVLDAFWDWVHEPRPVAEPERASDAPSTHLPMTPSLSTADDRDAHPIVRILSNPWMITIGGGSLVTALGVLLTVWWA